MASNSFGTILKITTWGESHGESMGVVIDGLPAGVPIDLEAIQQALAARRPGRNPLVSPRNEKDLARILSGVYEGSSTGHPISILIDNQDAKSEAYEPLAKQYRPGHAQYTYLKKYGIYDHRGGGRASARETALRVAAAACVKGLLDQAGIDCCAYLAAVGDHHTMKHHTYAQEAIESDPIFCPDPTVSLEIQETIEQIRRSGDSIGGIVAFAIDPVIAGLGEPIYDKLDAKLAYAMLSLPASKGFEIGHGMAVSRMQGSAHNDSFHVVNAEVKPSSNQAGGLLGGISTGEMIYGQVAFKPTSSIHLKQTSVDFSKETVQYDYGRSARHDPCVAIRAVPVVKAMCQLVLADCLLMKRLSCL